MKKSGKSIQMVLALLAAGTLLLNGCSAAKPAEKKSIRKGRKERVQDFLLPMRRCSRILDINTVAVIRFYSHLAGNYKK